VPAGCRHDRTGVFDLGCDRFFDEQIDAGLEQWKRHARMETGGCRHHGRCDAANEIARIGRGQAAVRLSHAGRGVRRGIDHRHELHVVAPGEQAGMDRAQMSAAHHRHLRLRHAALRRSRARPCRPSC